MNWVDGTVSQSQSFSSSKYGTARSLHVLLTLVCANLEKVCCVI